jgi:hypothetical protein
MTKSFAPGFDRAHRLSEAGWLPGDTLSPLLVQALFHELSIETSQQGMAVILDQRG